MKKVFLIYHTDIWQSRDSHRVVGIASTLGKAITMVKKDKDAVLDVKSADGHIVICEFTLNKIDSEKQVFSTNDDDSWYKITGE